MRTAAQLRHGERGTVTGFSNSEMSLKLMEMGVLPGQEIEFKFAAPFNGPRCFLVRGYQLSLRINEAEAISID